MLRVLKPGGAILWFDLRVDNPRNPQVKGLRKKEIASLFPGCDVDLTPTLLGAPCESPHCPALLGIWGSAAFAAVLTHTLCRPDPKARNFKGLLLFVMARQHPRLSSFKGVLQTTL